MRASYKKEDFPNGLIRSKYAARLAAKSNTARLDPEIMLILTKQGSRK